MADGSDTGDATAAEVFKKQFDPGVFGKNVIPWQRANEKPSLVMAHSCTQARKFGSSSPILLLPMKFTSHITKNCWSV